MLVDLLQNSAQIPKAMWLLLGELSPYLLLGFAVAGLLSVLVSQRTVEKYLGDGSLKSSFNAAIFGIPLPLCSCGVIPVSASLRAHGASRSATTSFLISTPQTGVDSIFVTWQFFGPVYAMFRLAAALLSGMLGGIAVFFFGEKEREKNAIHSLPDNTKAADTHWVRRALEYGFLDLPRDLFKSIVIGILIAGMISAFIPDDSLGSIFGGGIWGMLVMLVVGIPMYVCATGSVPIAATLMHKGISPGAALVFLMAGPATNSATIMTVWKVLGKKTAMIYLTVVALTSLISGLLVDFFALDAVNHHAMNHSHHQHLSLWAQLSSVVLLLVLFNAKFNHKNHQAEHKSGEFMKRTVMGIQGMTCNNCVLGVKRILEECPGVERADVSLSEAKATIFGEGFSETQIRERITQLGYTPTEAKT